MCRWYNNKIKKKRLMYFLCILCSLLDVFDLDLKYYLKFGRV